MEIKGLEVNDARIAASRATDMFLALIVHDGRQYSLSSIEELWNGLFDMVYAKIHRPDSSALNP